MSHDPVFKPKHYHEHPSGVECIQITEHMNFNLGNVVKYLWRAGKKGPLLEDLRKAKWYLDREIARLDGKDARPVDGLCQWAEGGQISCVDDGIREVEGWAD